MKHITTYNELVEKHAAEGDPTAFFTLFSPQLCEIYMTMRSKGIPHKQVVITISPTIRAMYRKFVKVRPRIPASQWFDMYRKMFKEGAKLSDTDNSFIENEDIQAIDEFKRTALLLLQREYAVLRDSYGEKYLYGGRVFGKVWATGLRVVAGLIILVVLYILFIYTLKRTNSKIDVSVTSPKYILSFSLPAMVERKHQESVARHSIDSSLGTMQPPAQVSGLPVTAGNTPAQPSISHSAGVIPGQPPKKPVGTVPVSSQPLPRPLTPAPVAGGIGTQMPAVQRQSQIPPSRPQLTGSQPVTNAVAGTQANGLVQRPAAQQSSALVSSPSVPPATGSVSAVKDTFPVLSPRTSPSIAPKTEKSSDEGLRESPVRDISE